MQDAYELLNEKMMSEKRGKNYFFCKLAIKDDNFFYRYISMIKTIKIFIYVDISEKFKKMPMPF